MPKNPLKISNLPKTKTKAEKPVVPKGMMEQPSKPVTMGKKFKTPGGTADMRKSHKKDF